MPAQWHQDKTTFRLYVAKVDLFERIINSGQMQDEKEVCLAQQLLDLVNYSIEKVDGQFTAIPEIAEVTLPIVEEAFALTHQDLMHNRLSVEMNAILALRSIAALCPDAHIDIPSKPLTTEVAA